MTNLPYFKQSHDFQVLFTKTRNFNFNLRLFTEVQNNKLERLYE